MKSKRKKQSTKEQYVTTPLNELEIKEASVYWDERGASLFVPAFLFILFVGVMVYHGIVNGMEIEIAPQIEEGALLGILVLIVLVVIYVSEFLNLMADMQKRQKIEIEGVFTKNGTEHRDMGYMYQKIGKQTLIFPPKIYHSLEKGDYMKFYCTSILKIVVSCEKIARK